MQDSLLSRFDLIFIVLDEMDPEHDRRISDHVLRMHRYRAVGEQDGEALPMGGGEETLTTGGGGGRGGGGGGGGGGGEGVEGEGRGNRKR